MNYYLFFTISLIVAIFSTLLIKKIALKLSIVDIPNIDRKIHAKTTPLLGGIAIFIAFFLTLFLARHNLMSGNLNYHHWLGFFTGGLIIIIGGYLDDKFNLPAKIQIIFPILAIISIILSGVTINKITNPFGDFLYFSNILSSVTIFIWLIVTMYTTKLLDGVDGLVSGLGVIGGFIIFLFTISAKYFQPDIATASIIFSGASLGFLIFNWNPAKIFLGEGGSLLIGFILGVLAIISGGKIAIAFLILGIPILDVFWTIIRRILEKKNPFNFSDKLHLHHRLLAMGLSPKKTVLIFYLMSSVFGLSALFLQSTGKIIAISILFIVMLLIISGFTYLEKQNNQ